MSYFKAKMHKIPRWGAYNASPERLAGFEGPTSKGKGESGRKGKGRDGENCYKGEGKRGRGEEACIRNFQLF